MKGNNKILGRLIEDRVVRDGDNNREDYPIPKRLYSLFRRSNDIPTLSAL